MKPFLFFFVLIVFVANVVAQSKIKPFVGGYINMDAEGVYFGLAVKGGINYQVKKTNFSLFSQYFGASVKSQQYNDNGVLRLATVGITAERFLFKEKLKRLYAGLGLCYQYRFENYQGAFIIDNEKRKIFTGCYKLGYLLSKNINDGARLAIELFGTGPYNETFDNGSYTEVLTQLGLGIKILF